MAKIQSNDRFGFIIYLANASLRAFKSPLENKDALHFCPTLVILANKRHITEVLLMLPISRSAISTFACLCSGVAVFSR